MATKTYSVEEYDEMIKKLQEKKKAAVLKRNKEIAAANATRNQKLYDAMKGFLASKNITDSQLIELDVKELEKIIFDNPTSNTAAQ